MGEVSHVADFLENQKKSQHSPESVVIDFDMDELRSIAALFAQVVNAKSRYTAEHSCGVATLCRHLAKRCLLNESQCSKIEVAGLLHDLGKLQVPDTVLERQGVLR